MGGKGGVDGGNHVVLVLVVDVVVLEGVGVGWLHAAHVCLHGQQRAVDRQLLVMGDVHAAKVTGSVSAVDDMAVWQDVSQGALLAKLAVALCEVLARRALRQRLVRVQKGTGLACLACALAVELARNM